MAIWAFNKPGDGDKSKFVWDSLQSGYSRFGWSSSGSADLNSLRTVGPEAMAGSGDKGTWSKCRFLLEIVPGDWIVHINVPKWGRCTAIRVTGTYTFDDEGNETGDFRHCIPIDCSSIVEFHRNDPNILPTVSRKLKLRGRYWRVRCEKEFLESLENLRNGSVSLKGVPHGVYFLRHEINKPLESISELIQRNHYGKNLESMLADVFRAVPDFEDVKVNGSGWGTDHGADLIVTYRAGLPIEGLEKQEKLVVQVKSYVGNHFEINAVKQLKVAIEKYEADAALLMTTGRKTDVLEEAIEKLSHTVEKPVSVLAGGDLARFVLKFYGSELL